MRPKTYCRHPSETGADSNREVYDAFRFNLGTSHKNVVNFVSAYAWNLDINHCTECKIINHRFIGECLPMFNLCWFCPQIERRNNNTNAYLNNLRERFGDRGVMITRSDGNYSHCMLAYLYISLNRVVRFGHPGPFYIWHTKSHSYEYYAGLPGWLFYLSSSS